MPKAALETYADGRHEPETRAAADTFALLQRCAGFVATEIALANLLVTAAADQSQFHQLFRGIGPAVMLKANQFTGTTPCVGIGIVWVIEIAEKTAIFTKEEVLANHSFGVDAMLAATDRSHNHLG